MGILEWVERRTAALTVWDIGAVKVYCVLFGMIVGAYVPMYVREHLWWFVLPVVILGLVLGYRWFTVDPS